MNNGATNTVVIGGGAVGSVLASLLVSETPVTLLVRRQDHARAVLDNGIRLDGPTSVTMHHLAASCDPRVLEDADLVIVATKSYDTEQVAKTIGENAKPDALVLTLQNGLGSLDVLGEICGADRVLGGITTIGCTKIDDTTIKVPWLGRVAVGEVMGPSTTRCRQVAERFSRAGFIGEAPDDIRNEIWNKLSFSVSQNALCALTNKSFGELLNSPSALAVARSLLDEFQLVAVAEGVLPCLLIHSSDSWTTGGEHPTSGRRCGRTSRHDVVPRSMQ